MKSLKNGDTEKQSKPKCILEVVVEKKSQHQLPSAPLSVFETRLLPTTCCREVKRNGRDWDGHSVTLRTNETETAIGYR